MASFEHNGRIGARVCSPARPPNAPRAARAALMRLPTPILCRDAMPGDSTRWYFRCGHGAPRGAVGAAVPQRQFDSATRMVVDPRDKAAALRLFFHLVPDDEAPRPAPGPRLAQWYSSSRTKKPGEVRRWLLEEPSADLACRETEHLHTNPDQNTTWPVENDPMHASRQPPPPPS